LSDCWYEKGLRFECKRCGDCCRGEPGYVWVTEADIARIAKKLKIGTKNLKKKYIRKVGNSYSLIEMSNGDCVFYSNGCAIYEVRPDQCRTFPFWPEYLSSPHAWAEAARRCPGVGSGTSFTEEEVDARLKRIRDILSYRE